MKDGGPAFPVVDNLGPLKNVPGMSLRDYFAAAALQGMLATPKTTEVVCVETLCHAAYVWADGMLAEREKEPTK